MDDIVFDIETDGLYWECTKVHVISLKPLGGVTESYSDNPIPGVKGSIAEGLQRLTESSTLIGHNIINFDIEVLKKIYNWKPHESTKIFDTLVVSRLLNPDRPKPTNTACKGGPHSLEAWGYRTGQAKPEHEDWSVFDSAMLRRNRQDVEINTSVYLILRSEIGDHKWDEAIELEHEVAKIITQQEINGIQFDVRAAESLVADLTSRIDSIDDRVLRELPGKLKPRGVALSKPYKVNGEYSKATIDHLSRNSDVICYESWVRDHIISGPFTRLEYIPMNLGSQPQVKDYLLRHGWIPSQWNYDDDGNKTSPVLNLDDDFGTVEGEIPKLIKDRVLYSHRRSQVQGWLDRVRPDGRITAGANTCGTNTGRFRHSTVVNVPKAAAHVAFGKEMRSLFTVPEGKVLVGHDAEGLELRMLAHYMDDPDFTNAVINGDKKLGTDIHTLNQKLASLPTRDAAKTFI